MIGQVISHYKILEKLGEGGMGVVYKARDTKLDRDVALKFLPPELAASDKEKSRFLEEAQSAATLSHPNICTIHEIGEEDGELFIVMEYLQGRSLRMVMNGGAMSVPETVSIALNIAEGLNAAHSNGIIHRDIKPENIVITEEGIAKIADFGLARSTRQPQKIELETRSGTIGYMSPEQLQGGKIGNLTDIWSLGVILYEMTAGRKPFSGEYDQATMYAIINEKQAAPPQRAKLPGRLITLIDRCLEKRPDARIQGAATLVDELKAIREEAHALTAKALKTIAILPFADLSPQKDNAYFSEGLTEEIITNLSQLQLIRVISRATVVNFKREEKTMKQIATELGVQYLLEGSVRKSGSNLRIAAQLVDAGQDAYLWAEKFDGTLNEIFEIQERVAGKIVKALKMRLTMNEKKRLGQRPTENAEAYQLYLKGRFFWNKRSKESLQTAIKYFEDAIKKDPKYARAWAGIADSYNLLSEYGGISRSVTSPKAMGAVRKALDLDDQLAEAHTSLACLLMLNVWDWPDSEKEFKRALRLDANYATAHHWYAEWLLFHGKKDEALREISRAVELDPLSPAILKDKGIILYYLEEYDGAVDDAKKTLDLDPVFAPAYRLLSLAYVGKGMIEEAISANSRWGELNGNEVESKLGLAWCYAVAGRNADALKLVSEIDPKELSDGNVLRGMALIYAALKEYDSALAWLEKAYEIKSESLTSIKIDPKFDALRTHPRFISLLNKMGLPQ